MNLFPTITRDDRWKNRSVTSIMRNSQINDEDRVRSLLSEIVKGDRSISINSWSEINNEHIIEFEKRIKEISLNSASDLSIPTIIDQNLENSKIPEDEDLENLKVSGEEGGRPSGESESSMGSNAAVTALRAREILLNYTADVDIISEDNSSTLHKLSPNIAFSFNKNQRSKTYLPGNSQGNHISSYISIIMAFINTIRNESGIDQAIDEIKNIGGLLLADDPDAVEQITRKQLYLSLSSEDRNIALKSISADLMASTLDKNGQPIEVPLKLLVKKSLINDKINQKARLLSELSHYILTEIQKSKDFTVYSRGRIGARKDEGATAKSSIRGLMALDKLCFISNISNDGLFQEEISYLLKSLSSDDRKAATENADEMDEDGQDAHLMRYGLTAWFEDDGAQADSLKDELESVQDDSQKRELLNSCISNMMQKNREEKTISAFIGGLFDYDRKLVFDYSKAFPLTKTELNNVENTIRDEAQLDDARMREIANIVRNNVRYVFEDEFDRRDIDVALTYDANKKISGRVILTRNDAAKLVNITVKHLGIMDIVSQNVLKCNSTNEYYEKAKKEFLNNYIIENAAWCEKRGLGPISFSLLIDEAQQKQRQSMSIS